MINKLRLIKNIITVYTIFYTCIFFYIFTFFPIFTISFFSKMFIEKDNFTFLYITNFEIYNWMSYLFFTSSRSKKKPKTNPSKYLWMKMKLIISHFIYKATHVLTSPLKRFSSGSKADFKAVLKVYAL